MKITFTKSIAMFAIMFAAFFGTSIHAQTVLYSNNFDAASDLANKPQLPKGWSSNMPNPNKVDSNWVLDSIKISTAHGASGHANLYIDSKTTPLKQEVYATFSGVSTLGYKNITLFWNERYSAKYYVTSHNRLRIDYSVDNGTTWDSTAPFKKDTTGGGLWFWANDSTPIVLPAKAGNVKNLMVRFVAYINASGGNYGFDDFSITGTKVVTGVANETEQNTNVKTWFANDQLNVHFNNLPSNEASLYIYNMNGQQVYQTINHSAGDMQVNLAFLNNGLYIAKVVTANGTTSSRFVK